MRRVVVKPKTVDQTKALMAFLKAFNFDFIVEKDFYDPEFVEMILQGREDIKNGKGVKIITEDLWKSI